MSQSFDYRSVLKPKSVLVVFNPNRTEIKKDYNGNTYTFPAEGTLGIEDTFGRKHTKDGTFENFTIPAEEIVAHFVGEDGISGHLGPLGVRVLSGDPEVDERIKEEARQVCKERLYMNDCAIRNAHMAAVRVAKEGGNPPPTPERHVIEAMTRIEAYESEGGSVLPFKCPDCNMPFKEADPLARHQEAQHKGMPVAASTSNAEVEALKATVATLTELVKAQMAAQAPAPRKPGRPKKTEAAA